MVNVNMQNISLAVLSGNKSGKSSSEVANIKLTATAQIADNQGVEKTLERERENTSDQLKRAVEYINDYVQSVQRDLNFSVDDASGMTVVKVIDRNSGELIRQIPNQVALDLAIQLQQTGEMALLKAQG